MTNTLRRSDSTLRQEQLSVDAALTVATRASAIAIAERGLDQRKNLVLLLIAGAAAFVTLMGVAISIAAVGGGGPRGLVVPCANLAATGVGVPLVAALVAPACTRGRLVLVRWAE